MRFRKWIENQKSINSFTGAERAERAKTLPMFNCMDCQRNTAALREYPYMMQDELWNSIVPGGKGMLCLDCASKRIQRPLKRSDFKMLPKTYEALSKIRENWDQPKYQLDGEYWITDDGSTMYADGDIGDYNHEGYVMMYVQGDIASDFNVHEESEFTDWDEMKKLIIKEILDDEDPESREELEYRVDDGEIDEIIIEKMNDPEAEEKMSIANGYGDAREYAIMKWGWKRVAGNNIESRALTPHDMQAIASGLNEIDEMLADDAEFSISVYGDQNYDVTLAELEAGKLKSYEPEIPEQGFSVGQQQPDLAQSWEQKRRQQQKWIDVQKDSASKQVKDIDLKNMHPYYQGKKFPFGDWNTNSFQNWMNLKENSEIGYRYVHNDGRGLMNNSSLNYDKLDDDEHSDVEDEYLGLQQPHSSLHNQNIIFVFTPEGEQRHQRLIELLSKASKTGVRREEMPISQYEIVWQSTDGQLGLKSQ